MVHNKKALFLKEQMILSDLIIADSFFTRMWGLMGKKGLSFEQGILLLPCNQIHMLFMQFSIDVIFLSRLDKKRYQISSLVLNVQPWHWMPVGDWKAYATLEVAAGYVAHKGLKSHEILCLS